ncbi:MAG: hypothetical protein A3F84_05400 [Candidatus Handelsmanbacteria bacterium RIFCSPLOWO2_12_FULL_64_10]|uniref:DUF4382 domain-containing protein n=1 Tax=Handelsmanbacteria sp. (strain RIFCSPLOWO2_12_FULL_64_10) TaxID=1817868 RepID=A0A1F6CBU8_HANXR|nr:MAG: hypothetical protein A3F84_05400 [Candidatus Handelsmanbacteria bacterium RIFCSPLOWO2_12_FULL_64_10]
MMKRLCNVFLVTVFAISLTACGDNAVSSGRAGRAQAIVTDNPSRATPLADSGNLNILSLQATAFSGSISANTNAFISADGRTWAALGSPNGVTIALQSTRDSTNLHGETDAPVATYAYVRLVMRSARATIKAGSTIGGVGLASDVILTLGGTDGEVTVEKQVPPFQVSANATTTILFELNAEAWATQQNAQDKVVEDAEIQSFTAVRTYAVTRT